MRDEVLDERLRAVAKRLDDLGSLKGDESYDKFITTITNAIPDPSTPLQLKRILDSLVEWEEVGWISSSARAAVKTRVVEKLNEVYVAEGAADAAASACIAEPPRASVDTSTTPSSVTAASRPSSRKTIATDQPGREKGQRDISKMLGPKTLMCWTKRPDGTKGRRFLSVNEFEEQPPRPPARKLPCSFRCGESFGSLQARIMHEATKHSGRDGIHFGGGNIVSMFNQDLPPADVKRCLDDLVSQVERDCATPAERERAERERAEQLEAKDKERREREAAAKAASAQRQGERTRAESGTGRRGEQRRHQYTPKEKMEYIEAYDKIKNDESIINKGARFEEDHGVSSTNVIKWSSDKERRNIYRASARQYASELLRIDKASRKKGKFAEMEKELHRMLIERRKRGRRCSPRWLSHSARTILRTKFAGTPGALDFIAGGRWRRRFLGRFNLTTRRKTNRKNTTWEESKPLLQHYFKRFHIWLKEQSARARAAGSPSDPRWGAFPPWLRLNVDQVPLPFINDCDTTYDERGSTQVRINGLQPGLYKRQCTLNLIFRPEAPPRPAGAGDARDKYDKHLLEQPKPAIIFRGTGARVSQAEKDAYAPDVHVLYQPKAWVDRPTAVKWVEGAYAELVDADEKAGVLREGEKYLLLQDNLDAQLQPAYIHALARRRTLSRWLLAGKTDYVQPVDAGLGRQVKIYVGEEMDKWLDDDNNLEKWEGNSLSSSDRRVLLTHWVSAAWKKTISKPETLRAYFEHTGALLDLEGKCAFKFDGVTEPFQFLDVALPTVPAARAPPAADEPDDSPGSDVGDLDDGLDDEDDPDEDDLPASELKAPDGWRLVLEAPTATALEFSRGASQLADALVGRQLLYNWITVGWCEGTITRRNTDARRKLGGEHYNFFVHYEIDDQEASHVLQLDSYVTDLNAERECGQWVLLERV